MGKEMKIGLSVVGSLLVIFGVLLFRHLSNKHSDHSLGDLGRVAEQPLTADGMHDRPNVVAAQKDPSGIKRSRWGDGKTSGEAEEHAPARSYMPDEGAATDRYADQHPAQPEEPQEETPAVASSPFHGRRLDYNEAPADSDAPAEDAPRTGSRNPLRRLSAELPLETTETAADPPAEPAELPERSGRYQPPADLPSEPAEEEPVPPAADELQTEMPRTALPINPAEEPPAEPEPQAAEDRQPEPAVEEPPAEDLSTQAPPRRPAPEPVIQNGMYTVQPNDTLWSISERVYGTGGYFKAIAAHNRSRLPQSDKLTVGNQLAVPAASELEQLYPTLCPKQRKSVLVKPGATPPSRIRRAAGDDIYVVEEGDTLFDIARHELGKASRWAEIYELNREVLGEDFDYLKPGVELRLPQKPRVDAATRASYQSRQ